MGVCVMHAQEMKCIVGHKKELSNVGAPSFLPPLKAECLCNYRGRVTAHTTHSNMRLTAQCLCFIKLLNTLWCSSLVLHLIIYPSFFLLLFYLFLSGISFPPLHFFSSVCFSSPNHFSRCLHVCPSLLSPWRLLPCHTIITRLAKLRCWNAVQFLTAKPQVVGSYIGSLHQCVPLKGVCLEANTELQ